MVCRVVYVTAITDNFDSCFDKGPEGANKTNVIRVKEKAFTWKSHALARCAVSCNAENLTYKSYRQAGQSQNMTQL
jgi:hypothetical protein